MAWMSLADNIEIMFCGLTDRSCLICFSDIEIYNYVSGYK